MEDIIDIIVTETTNLITITSSGSDEVIDVNIIDNREDIVLNVTPSVVEININSLTGNFGVNWGQITGTLSNQTDLNTALGLKADLVGGKVPSSQLPSYVDDVVEVANYAALPATGETGKIYITLDTNFMYRWSGSTYIEIKDSSAVWGAITGTLSSQTDLQNALNAKFDDPTGDTTQYIAGDGSLITFPIAGQAGTLVREVRNTTGATLTKGTIIYISGATGNKPTVSKAIATGDSTSAQTFGMLQANIANNANGYAVCVGDLTGLDTSAFTEGNQLYLSSTTAGAYTVTKQLAPAHLVYIGIVTRAHPTLGQIEVNIQNGYELYELHDVSITSVADNQGLFYELSTDLWKNKSIATVLGYTPANGANYLPLAGGTMTGAIVGTTATFTNSGSGIALGVTQSGASGDGIRITHSLSRAFTIQSSGSGFGILINNDTASTSAPFTIQKQGSAVVAFTDAGAGTFNSSLTASSFVKSSGTSAQFLKADGSVDSSTYVKGSGTATYLASWSSTANTLTGSFISFASNITSVEGMGLSSLNGIEINGNYGAGGGGQKIRSFDETTGNAYIDFANTGGRFYLGVNRSTSGGLMTNATAYATVLTTALGTTNLEFGTNATKRMTIDGTSGAVTLTSTISATGGTLTGALSGTTTSFTSSANIIGVINTTNANGTTTNYQQSGTNIGWIGNGSNALIGGSTNDFTINGVNSLNLAVGGFGRLTIASTGAATFSSSVTATTVSINTTSTSFTPLFLNANGNYSASGNMTSGFAISNGTTGRALNMGVFDSGAYAWIQGAYVNNADTTFALALQPKGGNVGIGTTTPTARLEVVGGIPSLFTADSQASSSTYGGSIFYRNHTGVGQGNGLTFSLNNASGSRAEYAYIGGVIETNTAGSHNGGIIFASALNGNRTEQVRITSGGQVQIKEAGGTHTSDGLSLINTNSNTWNLLNAGDNFFYFGYNGTSKAMINPNNGSYGALSDKNKKEQIELSNIGLSEIMQLKPSLYRFKDNKDNNSIKELGFIAQEVKDCIPNAYVESGEFIGLNYNPIVAALTKAVQELKAELDTLKNK